MTKYMYLIRGEHSENYLEFSKSGAHLEAMKESKKIAKNIKTLTIDSDKLLDWKTAKELR